MSEKVNIHEAKTHLSRLIQRVQRGEQIIIAKAGRPVARLTAVEAATAGRRIAGTARGQVHMSKDFDSPLPDELRRHFEP